MVNDLVLVNTATCPICLETRAASLQALIAGVAPAVFAPLSSVSVSNINFK